MKLGGEVRQGGEGVGQEHNSGPLAAQKVQNIFFKSFKVLRWGFKDRTQKTVTIFSFFSKIHTTNPQEN